MRFNYPSFKPSTLEIKRFKNQVQCADDFEFPSVWSHAQYRWLVTIAQPHGVGFGRFAWSSDHRPRYDSSRYNVYSINSKYADRGHRGYDHLP